MPERKAVYLSILDAALNGSFYITTDDAIEIFGISENYVERTRNITQEIGKKKIRGSLSMKLRGQVSVQWNRD